MIKDGFGQSYLFDNHWSATVMDGKENFHPFLLPPHNHGSPFWYHLIYFPRLSSRSRLSLKEKNQIELKLLTHPKQGLCALKNHTYYIHPLPFMVNWCELFMPVGPQRHFIMLKCIWHIWWRHKCLYMLAVPTHLERMTGSCAYKQEIRSGTFSLMKGNDWGSLAALLHLFVISCHICAVHL